MVYWFDLFMFLLHSVFFRIYYTFLANMQTVSTKYNNMAYMRFIVSKMLDHENVIAQIPASHFVTSEPSRLKEQQTPKWTFLRDVMFTS